MRRTLLSVVVALTAACGAEAPAPGGRTDCIDYRYRRLPTAADLTFEVEVRTVAEGACGGITAVRALLFEDRDGNRAWSPEGDALLARFEGEWASGLDRSSFALRGSPSEAARGSEVFLRLEVETAERGPVVVQRLVRPASVE